MNTSGKIRVGVVFGGRSGEHEVSLVSAQSIMKALDPQKYEVIPIGVSKQGTWVVGADPKRFLPAPADRKQLDAAPAEAATKTALIGDPSHQGMILLDRTNVQQRVKLDVVFPIVHGTYGEDGTLQGLLEMADLPYVGCGVMASSVGMDKTTAKRLFRDAGLPIAPFTEHLRREWREQPDKVIAEIEAAFPYPCFIKPVNSGSSVGVSKAHDREELRTALDLAAKYDRKILVEASINGRELEVSVLGNDAPIASIPGEIVPCNEFYDYKAKYVDDRSELHIPAKITDEQTAEIREMAVRAYRALDCAGMARVDFFLDRDTGKFILNEVNTIPGFTSISMYPKLWEATGITYQDLVTKLVEFAFERYNDRQESLKAIMS
ncbi:MAG TPA: D-alanine--D-alanine ligase family protein [Candidatus Ozemobacteraceae bacterium]